MPQGVRVCLSRSIGVYRPPAVRFNLIAPSFGDHRSIVTEVRPFLAAHQNLQKSIFVTMANEGGQQLGGAWELSAILEEEAPAAVRWEFRRYPDESHGSVPLPSVYDGLQAIYGGWYLQDPIQTYEMGGMPAIERHYAALSERMKYVVPVPESVLIDTFNSLLVRLSGQPDKTEAEAVIEKALALYPESPFVHFYAGRFYGSISENERAIDHLTRSLVLDPGFGAARRMLSAYGVDVAAIVPDP